MAKQDVWVAKMTGEHRMILEDRVPQSRIEMRWNVPEWGNEATWYLDMVSDVLARGKNSRFYKRLV
ncbi:MAG: zinc protease [Rhodothermales bacterium]|jgi:zinc protease